jgi:protein ECT2
VRLKYSVLCMVNTDIHIVHRFISIDLHIFLEQEPPDQSDRWSNRPFRSLSVVHPPLTASQSSTSVAEDKTRFLENIWLAQAMYRSRSGRSVPFVSQERDVGSSSRRVTLARTYFNVYQRTAYLSEPKKVRLIGPTTPWFNR